MFCPKCGAQNTEGAAFCAQCSAQINTAAYPTEAKSKKPGNGMAVGSLISGIVGFFILVRCNIIYFTR